MLTIAPTVADYASKVHFNRPDISVEDAAKTGIQTAHLFRAYQPAALSKLLDMTGNERKPRPLGRGKRIPSSNDLFDV
jgi:hypothetical protein